MKRKTIIAGIAAVVLTTQTQTRYVSIVVRAVLS